MNPIRLEDRFRGHENDVNRYSFWFAYFSMSNPYDQERIYADFFNCDELSSDKVEMYCEMWKKFMWN